MAGFQTVLPGVWVLTGKFARVPYRGGWTLCAVAFCSKCGKPGLPQVRGDLTFKKIGGATRCCIGHGHTKRNGGARESREYVVWLAMKNRCLNENAEEYTNYGERGIKVCTEWQGSFARFLADMGPRPPGTSIDRVDVDGNYEPGNCRWATVKEQARNKRNTRRYGAAVSELAERCGLKADQLKKRLSRGWDLDRAMSTPIRAARLGAAS